MNNSELERRLSEVCQAYRETGTPLVYLEALAQVAAAIGAEIAVTAMRVTLAAKRTPGGEP